MDKIPFYGLMNNLVFCTDDYFGEVYLYIIRSSDLLYKSESSYTTSRYIQMDKVVLAVNAKKGEDETQLTQDAISEAIYNEILSIVDELSKKLRVVTECNSLIPESCAFYLKTSNGFFIGFNIEKTNIKWQSKIEAMVLCDER